MSIIIKGIDLPKHDEGICVTIWKDGIVYARDIKTDTTIETEAEAIQIPAPHGRIIDASEVNKHIIGDVDLRDCPTILESEE